MKSYSSILLILLFFLLSFVAGECRNTLISEKMEWKNQDSVDGYYGKDSSSFDIYTPEARHLSAPIRVPPFPDQLETENRTTFLMLPVPGTQLLCIRIIIHAGSNQDPKNKSGLAELTLASMISCGTNMKNGQEIIAFMEKQGVIIQQNCFDEYMSIDLTMTLIKDSNYQDRMQEIMELFLSIIIHPRFEERFFNQVKKQFYNEKMNMTNSVFFKQLQKMKSLCYGTDDPKSFYPTSATITSIQAKDCQEFHQKHVFPENISITLGGETLLSGDILKLKWEKWKKKGMICETISSVKSYDKEMRVFLAGKHPNRMRVLLGTLAPMPFSPDYPYFILLFHYLIGNGTNSRIWNELRKKEGLVYTINKGMIDYVESPGLAYVFVEFDKKNGLKGLQILESILEELIRQPLDSLSLQTMKLSLISKRLFIFQDVCQSIRLWHKLLLYHKTWQDFYILHQTLQEASPGQLWQAALRYWDKNHLIWLVEAPADMYDPLKKVYPSIQGMIEVLE